MMGVQQQMGAVPMPAVTAILSRYDRSQLEAFISFAIDLIDLADGDSDLEANGDEHDGNNAEDEILHSSLGGTPGCPVSDGV